MNQAMNLLGKYRQQLRLPDNPYLSPTERVWIAVHAPEEERRVRASLPGFALATEQAGRNWHELDLTQAFARWLQPSAYREAYFREPELFDSALPEFEAGLLRQVRQTLSELPPRTVVGVTGVGSLFGLTRVSRLIEETSPALTGRMLLFFPGSLDGHNYRLLNARDGWNYHSIALTLST